MDVEVRPDVVESNGLNAKNNTRLSETNTSDPRGRISSSDLPSPTRLSTTRSRNNSVSEHTSVGPRASLAKEDFKPDDRGGSRLASRIERDSKSGKLNPATSTAQNQTESNFENPVGVLSGQQTKPDFSKSDDANNRLSASQGQRDSKSEISLSAPAASQTKKESKVESPQLVSLTPPIPRDSKAEILLSAPAASQIKKESKVESPQLVSSTPTISRNSKAENKTYATSRPQIPRDSKSENLTTVPSAEASQIPRDSKSEIPTTSPSAEVSQIPRNSKSKIPTDGSASLQRDSKSENVPAALSANPIASPSVPQDLHLQRSTNEGGGAITNIARPSVTAAIRRGSFYGDVTPRASIVDLLATSPPQRSPSRSDSASSLPDSDTTSISSDHLEDLFEGRWRVYVMAILKGFLERLELMAILPGANSTEDTSLNLADFPPEGLAELANKTKILNAANLIKYSLGKPSKESQFAIEVSYLMEVMTLTLKEVEESGTFHNFMKIVEDELEKQKKLPACIAHIKQLKENNEMLKNLMEAERQAHKNAMREWAKNIAEKKRELKELRKQNMIEYRYKADTTLAVGDLARRYYEVRLADLRAEKDRLKNDVEVEKRAHEASVEFLKKQNMELREEAVALQAGIEADTHTMDHMLEKMRTQNKEKAAILAELEPRYMARMAEIEAARLEAIRKEEEFFANQGQIELQTFAALKIQRIWRGYAVRKVWKKKIKKKKGTKEKRKGSPKRKRPGGAKK